MQSSLQSEFLVQLVLSYIENSSLSPKQKYFLQSLMSDYLFFEGKMTNEKLTEFKVSFYRSPQLVVLGFFQWVNNNFKKYKN